VKPLIDVNFEEVFANSDFLNELSTMVFGAELALNYLNVPDVQIKAVTDKIVQSAFSSFSSLNYNSMYAAARPKNITTTAYESGSDVVYSAARTVHSAPDPTTEVKSKPETAYEYPSNPQIPLSSHENSAPDNIGFSVRSYQSPNESFQMRY
jgi:hypothetical protein